MNLNKQVVHMFLREVHVRDFDGQAAEPTKMHRLDYELNPNDPNLVEFRMTFMFAHFGTQVDGVIEATVLMQNMDDEEVDLIAAIKAEEDMFAIPLFSKASAVITKLTEDRGQFPIIVPVDLWMED